MCTFDEMMSAQRRRIRPADVLTRIYTTARVFGRPALDIRPAIGRIAETVAIN